MANYLTRSLDRATEGALSRLNQSCERLALSGHVTVTQEDGCPVVIFTGHDREGTTRHFQRVPVQGQDYLLQQVAVAEEIRHLKKRKAGFAMNPASKTTVWN